MRINMIRQDYVDTVIGLGKGLFYNSPMPACILILRSNKPANRKNKILFINAENLVSKQGTMTYLLDVHIKEIARAYNTYETEPGFASIVLKDTVLRNEGSMKVAQYVVGIKEKDESISINETFNQWCNMSKMMHQSIEELVFLLGGENNEV